MSSSRGSWVAWALLAAVTAWTCCAPTPTPSVDGAHVSIARRAQAIVATTDWSALRRCGGDGGSPSSLVLATIAVESHARPAWVRAIKHGLARGYWAVTGALPDLSLGVAQMKPTTAIRLIAARSANPLEPTAAEVWSRLTDVCASTTLVQWFFDAHGGGPRSDGLADYNGQSATTRIGARSAYAPLVSAVADRLDR